MMKQYSAFQTGWAHTFFIYSLWPTHTGMVLKLVGSSSDWRQLPECCGSGKRLMDVVVLSQSRFRVPIPAFGGICAAKTNTCENYRSGKANSFTWRLPPIELVDHINYTNWFLIVNLYFFRLPSCYYQGAESAPTWRCISFCSPSLCVEMQEEKSLKCCLFVSNSDWKSRLMSAASCFQFYTHTVVEHFQWYSTRRHLFR